MGDTKGVSISRRAGGPASEAHGVCRPGRSIGWHRHRGREAGLRKGRMARGAIDIDTGCASEQVGHRFDEPGCERRSPLLPPS
jgi:hypothetical protein